MPLKEHMSKPVFMLVFYLICWFINSGFWFKCLVVWANSLTIMNLNYVLAVNILHWWWFWGQFFFFFFVNGQRRHKLNLLCICLYFFMLLLALPNYYHCYRHFPIVVQYWYINLTNKARLFSFRRTVKNIPKYAPAQFYIDNVLPRVKEKKIMALKPFVDRLG